MKKSLEARRVLHRDEALDLLFRVECQRKVIEHCKHVAKNAVEIALKALKKGASIDLQLIEIGALLHDIGRSVTHDVRHGFIGAKIARSFGVDEQIIGIIEKHVGSGIPANESANLGLPKKDYIPTTLEEKIVCYSDKITKNSRKIGFNEAVKEFKQSLGSDHPAIYRFKTLHKEILEIQM